jgi:hypothetical protein
MHSFAMKEVRLFMLQRDLLRFCMVIVKCSVKGSGRICFAEFCKLMKHQQSAGVDEKRLEEQDARQVFRVSKSTCNCRKTQ